MISILITIAIAIWGISTYSSGNGYMTFLGIELSPAMFAVLIGVFIIWDVWSITAMKKQKERAAAAQALARKEAEAEQAKIDDGEAPEVTATILVTRKKSALGAAVPAQILLNGLPVGALKNGETLTVTTHRRQNTIANSFAGAKPLAFTVEDGAEANIFLKSGNFVKKECTGISVTA